MPQAPPAATIAQVSATSLTLQLYPTRDNGGAIVTDYLLYRNQGDNSDSSATLTQISTSSYTYLANGFLATLADFSTESITPGLFYQFSYLAVNNVGTSDHSSIVTVPVADYPDAPTGLQRVQSIVPGRTSIWLEWDVVADTQLPAGQLTGYKLWMDNGLHGDFELVYNGEGVPDVRTFEANGLVTGRPYRFYAVAVNHVGESPASDLVTIYSCEAPSSLAAPTKSAIS